MARSTRESLSRAGAKAGSRCSLRELDSSKPAQNLGPRRINGMTRCPASLSHRASSTADMSGSILDGARSPWKTSSSALTHFGCPAISAAGNWYFCVFGAESTPQFSGDRLEHYFFGAASIGPTGAYRCHSALRSTGPHGRGQLKANLLTESG